MASDGTNGYDRGTSIFSPDGRMYQVEYAREAVKRGTASIGVETADGIVIAADRRVHSDLIKPESVMKIHPVDEHIVISSAGNVADTQKLVEFSRVEAQRHRHELDQPITVDGLTQKLTDHLQTFTQKGGTRPYGVALLVGGVSDGRPMLFALDPSGTAYEWYEAAVGQSSDAARSHLEEAYTDGLDRGAGVELALESLGVTTDQLEADKVDVTVVDAERGQFTKLSEAELASALAEISV